MILDIVGTNASWSDNRLSVAFDVVPEELAHLDLKTGEIFQNENTAKFRKQTDKAIAAQLYVTWKDKNAAGDELPSEMRYLPSTRSGEALISLVWRPPDDHLPGFHALTLAGHFPRRAVIFLPHDKLGFGWEPDGSGQTWDTEQARTIPIENVRFDLGIGVTSADGFWNTEVPAEADPVFFGDAAKVNFAVIQKLSAIETTLGRLSAAVGLIALVVLGLALAHYWH